MIRLQFEEALYPPTNQVSNLNYVYDTNGNVKQNSLSMNFSWNAAGQPITVSGVGATYDALGRLVETNNSGSYTQYIYRPSGDKLGAVSVSNGVASVASVAVPLPGGMGAVYNSGGLNYVRHMDYLGSSRLATTWAHSVYAKESYAPFGEPYNETSTTDRVFTGQTQSTTSGVYDYLFRKYDPAARRWLSPDPAGWDAVNQSAPQSLNRYAYVMNNPMSAVDACGLDCVYLTSGGDGIDSVDHNSDQGECWQNGGYWAPGYVPDDNSYITFDPNSDAIGIVSISSWGYVSSVANCISCSTVSVTGTPLGAFTQTIGTFDPFASVSAYNSQSFAITPLDSQEERIYELAQGLAPAASVINNPCTYAEYGAAAGGAALLISGPEAWFAAGYAAGRATAAVKLVDKGVNLVNSYTGSHLDTASDVIRQTIQTCKSQ